MRVNCGALPPDLIESELFGHEKGSFTGALGSRRGWFERADAGALEPLENVIRAHLAKALAITRGRIDGPRGAAQLLQVNASTLRAKLRKYRLEPVDYR